LVDAIARVYDVTVLRYGRIVNRDKSTKRWFNHRFSCPRSRGQGTSGGAGKGTTLSPAAMASEYGHSPLSNSISILAATSDLARRPADCSRPLRSSTAGVAERSTKLSVVGLGQQMSRERGLTYFPWQCRRSRQWSFQWSRQPPRYPLCHDRCESLPPLFLSQGLCGATTVVLRTTHVQ
jgi:hypothetical protein